MQIVSALFADDIQVRQGDGGAARLDLTGIQFSSAAPSAFPVTVTPHLVVIVRCPTDHSGTAALEVVFRRVNAGGAAPEASEGAGAGATAGTDGASDEAGDEQVARNVQALQIEPGKFAYRLVRPELDFPAPGTIEAHCRIDMGEVIVVPYTLLDPVD